MGTPQTSVGKLHGTEDLVFQALRGGFAEQVVGAAQQTQRDREAVGPAPTTSSSWARPSALEKDMPRP